MRKLSSAIFSIVLVLTVGCTTNQTSFSDTIPALYTLSTNVSPDDMGTVNPSGGEFVSGEGILIEARPSEGYVFERWDDDLTGNLNPDSLFFNRNKTVTAYFTERDYDLNIEIVGNGFVRETVVERSSGENEASGSPAATVRLFAAADEGWVFGRWEGDLSGSSNPATLIVDREMNVTVIFVREESDDAGGAMTIEEVKLFIEKLELDGYNNTEDFEAEYFIENLPLDGSPFAITHGEIPAGLYDHFEMKIEKPGDDIELDDTDFRDDNESYSLVVKGTYYGEEFMFRSSEDFEIDVDLDPPLEVEDDQNSTIVIDVDVESWFTESNGDTLDPDDSRNWNRINNNIEASFEEFEEGY